MSRYRDMELAYKAQDDVLIKKIKVLENLRETNREGFRKSIEELQKSCSHKHSDGTSALDYDRFKPNNFLCMECAREFSVKELEFSMKIRKD